MAVKKTATTYPTRLFMSARTYRRPDYFAPDRRCVVARRVVRSFRKAHIYAHAHRYVPSAHAQIYTGKKLVTGVAEVLVLIIMFESIIAFSELRQCWLSLRRLLKSVIQSVVSSLCILGPSCIIDTHTQGHMQQLYGCKLLLEEKLRLPE